MKFHPNSTHNSTTGICLTIRTISVLRWKGGITNDKKYFSGKEAENILTTVKKKPFPKGDKREGVQKKQQP